MNMHHPAPGPLTAATYHVMPKTGSTKLIIFFTATGAKPGRFNFWNDGKVLPCHRIFINNGHNEWYQNGVPGMGVSVQETAETLRSWASYLGATEIYCCGGSMGAYAAILFGAMLGGRVLSFAAETTLGIEGSRSVSHIKPGTQLVFPDLTDMITASQAPIIHYVGEMDPIDVYCASTIPSSANLTIKTISGVDHNPPRYVRDVGLLPEFLNNFITNQPMPNLPGEGDVLSKTEFPSLFLGAFQAFKRQDWADAEKLGLSALEHNPSSDFCLYITSLSQFKLGKHSEALPKVALAAAVARKGTEYHQAIQLHMAACIRHVLDSSRAAEIYRDILKDDDACHKAHFGLGLCYKDMKQPTLALTCFEAAAAIQPSNETYRKRLAAYQR